MPDAIILARALVLAFFAACFLQSGLDKVFDWKGNIAWLVPHFEKTPAKGSVPLLLAFITILELSTALACLLAILGPVLAIENMGTIAMALACATLVILFAGQRVAKDYAGAASLTAYFAVALVGLFIHSNTFQPR